MAEPGDRLRRIVIKSSPRNIVWEPLEGANFWPRSAPFRWFQRLEAPGPTQPCRKLCSQTGVAMP